ncbi:hypothetical protein IPH70_00475 [Candidatus Roizmanbacteria bacterium]|nr:MAG: hypothetical protein IPH70_00475 [Candidatus Roizmanbacteria bacterium]
MVKVPALLSEVSIPFVPPEIVLVAPNAVVEEPKSPAKVIVELSSSPFEIEVPRVVTSVLPAALSPVPVKSVMVSPPTVSDPAETEPVTVRFWENRPEPTTSTWPQVLLFQYLHCQRR